MSTHKLSRSQTSVWVPRPPGRGPLTGQLYMLVDDSLSALIPYHRDRGTCTHVVPADKAVASLIREAISRQDRGFWDLDRALREFMRLCGTELLIEGRAIFEIVFLNDGAGKPVEFDLVLINPKTLREERGRFCQVIPQEIATERNSRTEVELSAETLAVFDLPPAIRSKIRGVVETLQSALRSPMPNWAMEQMTSDEHATVPYDFSEHIKDWYSVIARATKRCGWNARGLWSDDYATEYYDIVRRLRFESFKIELRDHILNHLNRVLAIAGCHIGFDSRIELVDLPSLGDVAAARTRLSKGEGSFREIFDLFR